jgi:signal peptidase I
VLTLSSAELTELLSATLARGAPFRFSAKGSSMNPFIKDGDAITISPLRTTDLGDGDVVAFKRFGTDRLVIHRIVGIRNGLFLIQGDNISGTDGVIPAAELLGRVTKVERKGRNCRIGLGPERRLIALFSRFGLLVMLLLPIRKIYRLFVRIAGRPS